MHYRQWICGIVYLGVIIYTYARYVTYSLSKATVLYKGPYTLRKVKIEICS